MASILCVFSVILDVFDAAEGIYRFPSPSLPPASNGFVCPVNAACLLSAFWKRPERNLGLGEMRGDAVTDGLRILGPTRPSSLSVQVIGFPCSLEKHMKKVDLLFVCRFSVLVACSFENGHRGGLWSRNKRGALASCPHQSIVAAQLSSHLGLL